MAYSVQDFEINVPRQELLNKLKENRQRHVEIYLEALQEFRLQAGLLLAKRIGEVDTLEPKDILSFQVNAPRSFEDSYNQLIEMLELSIDENVLLTGRQFKAWVRDDWAWKDEFTNNTVIWSPPS